MRPVAVAHDLSTGTLTWSYEELAAAIDTNNAIDNDNDGTTAPDEGATA